MWELDYKESWALKNWCFWTVVLEKTHESPLHCKIKPVNPKGNQPWIFFGRTDAEAPILWPDNGKDLLIGKEKTPMPRKTEGRRMRGRQRMRWLDGITDQWTWVWASSGSWWWTRKPGVHGVAELDTTEQLNWTDWLSSEAKLGFFFCPTSRAVVNVGNRLPPQVTFHVDSFSATVFKCTFPQLTHREEKDKILLLLDTTTIDRGLPWWLSCQSAYTAGDLGLIPWIPDSGRSLGEGNGNPLQYSCLENSLDRGAWWATAYGIPTSWTQLSDFTFIFFSFYKQRTF